MVYLSCAGLYKLFIKDAIKQLLLSKTQQKQVTVRSELLEVNIKINKVTGTF